MRIALEVPSLTEERPYPESLFTIEGSRISNGVAILDAAPTDDRPLQLMQRVPLKDLLPAVCPG
jgi:hypothetical protein